MKAASFCKRDCARSQWGGSQSIDEARAVATYSCARLHHIRTTAIDEMDEKKHAKFPGKLLFVGFGSVAQGTLPLILRHIDMPRDRISILTADERGRKEAEHYGIKFTVNPIARDNVEQ